MKGFIQGAIIFVITAAAWLLLFSIGVNFVEKWKEEQKQATLESQLKDWHPQLTSGACYQISSDRTFQVVSIDQEHGLYRGFLLTKDGVHDLRAVGATVHFRDIEGQFLTVPCP